MTKFALTLILCFTLAGCALVAPRDTGNAHRVLLNPLEETDACKARVGSLIVTYPDVPDMLDTSRIALIDPHGRWDYFSGMRWADFLAGNIQSALVRSLSASGHFHSVASDDTVARGQLRLDVAVHKFMAVYHAENSVPYVEIEIAFTLRQSETLGVRKQFTARSTVKAEADSADAISSAFENAFRHIQHTAMQKLSPCMP